MQSRLDSIRLLVPVTLHELEMIANFRKEEVRNRGPQNPPFFLLSLRKAFLQIPFQNTLKPIVNALLSISALLSSVSVSVLPTLTESY